MVTRVKSTVLLVCGLLPVALMGCSEEKTERIFNKQTYSFEGVFENQYNGDLLEFKDAQVTFIKENHLDVTKTFEVKDNYLTIQMRNSSKEKREDIVMRIHGNNELLTCNVCAKYQLASTWQKRDFSPLPAEVIK